MVTVKDINLELHCHTVFSQDGLIQFDSLVQATTKIGIDAIAITDHDTIEGAIELQRWVRANSVSLQVIIGEERTLRDGTHLIGLFLREPIASSETDAVIDEIQSQGGLCLAPHPFRKKDGLLRKGAELLPTFVKQGVAFEIFNGKASGLENRQALDLLGLNIVPFAGSDAHYESDLGECLNVIQWTGDLRTSVERMLRGQGKCHILARTQSPTDTERRYAPLYYRVKKFLKLPKPLLPLAKGCYRRYRNATRGIGRKSLIEIYARP
jgi:predicted metal-dependent phosphoesterase TrpH